MSTAGPNGFLINAVALVRDVGEPQRSFVLHLDVEEDQILLSCPCWCLADFGAICPRLSVVDVYQGWCGPCKPVVSLFQKMRIEVGLDLLHFALAEADCLDVLEKYRGRCEPTFLFYAGGELVALVRGANAPLLQKTIREQLQAEKRVLAEGRERRVIKDEALSDEDECFSHEKEDGDDEDAVSSEKACTLAVIKPDAVAHGKTDEIIMK
ncbi:Thioredoxin domain-containing protein 6, partial [Eschrichtius robustus]|nr:Thioredoxin domain-containing protein 6 [Eschrichtius robustus]